MRCAILGFIGGAAWLQTQATLPDAPALALLAAAAALSIAAYAATRRLHAAPPPAAPSPTAPSPAARRAGPLLLALAGALIGYAWAAVLAHQALAHGLAKADEGRDFEITGVVDSLPNRFEGGVRFHFAIEDTGRQRLPPKIALAWYAARLPELQPGQRWQLKVRLQQPHGNANPHGFDYELWLLEQGVRATGYVRAEGRNQQLSQFVPSVHNVIEASRYQLRQRIRRMLPEQPYAGVVAALVMGDQRGISQRDWQVFNRTGISHLVSISGLHITMIAGLAAWLAAWLWRKSFFMPRLQLPLYLPAARLAAIAGMLAAAAYVALAGFGVPAQRTLYMLAVVAAAMWLNRLTAISHVLALAAGMVVLLDPWAVMGPGFWLSFGAVAAILYATLGRARSGPRMVDGLLLAAKTQYAVTLGLVPLTMLLFSQVSIVSPLANAVAIPVVSLLVTPMALAGAVLPEWLAQPLLLAAHWLLALLVDALRSLSTQPLAVWQAPTPAAWQFLWASAGTAWLLAPRGWPVRWLGLACWLPLLAARPDSPPPGAVRAIAFDVGQGMAVLVETASHRLLYDTGPQYSPDANGGNRVILPYLRARGITALDGIVVSHSDSDHVGGAMEILNGARSGWLLSSLPPQHPLLAAGVRHSECGAGQAWQWDGVRFEILHPLPGSDAPKANARSCVLKVSAAGGAILLAGDIEAAQEADLLARQARLRAEVLLVPHHGSGTSSTAAFLAAVQPRHAVFQLGYRNRYHHPKAQVVQRYTALGSALHRTDIGGAITVQVDGQVQVAEYRQQRQRYWHGR